MENLGIWVTPLLFLPGVALLIMSTSLRYGQIHDEFHNLAEHQKRTPETICEHLVTRARLFRNSLVCLYTSFGLFSFASLLGGLTSLWANFSFLIIIIITCVGILSLVIASIALIRESFLSLEVLEEHAKAIQTVKSS